MLKPSLWHLARVHHLLGQHELSYVATKEALALSTAIPQAMYDHARYCALTGRGDESVASLGQAIESDTSYALKALADDSFNSIKDNLNALFKSLAEEHGRRAAAILDRCRRCLSPVQPRDRWYSTENRAQLVETTAHAAGLAANGTFLDAVQAEELARRALDGFIGKTVAHLDQVARDLSHAMPDREPHHEERGCEEITGVGCAVSLNVGVAGLILVVLHGYLVNNLGVPDLMSVIRRLFPSASRGDVFMWAVFLVPACSGIAAPILLGLVDWLDLCARREFVSRRSNQLSLELQQVRAFKARLLELA